MAGVSSAVANNIVEYRESNNGFKSRKELLKVKKLGEKSFEQCAGFLRISEGDNILDNTSVHPESYKACEELLKLTGHTLQNVKDKEIGTLRQEVERLGVEKVAATINVGVPTLNDIINELLKPGRDS